MEQSSKTVKIARENQTTRFVGFVLLGLSVLVAAWFVFRPSAPRILTVVSLEEKWDLLETSAHNMRNDAYLMSVAISTDRTNPYAITAEYHSAHVADKMIFVGMDRFNKIDATWVNIAPSSNEPQKQIQRNDWAIDSREALSIFAKDEAINTCLESSKSTIQLSLHRTIMENVIWSLWVMDCPKEGDSKMDYLNAQTGERTDPFGQ